MTHAAAADLVQLVTFRLGRHEFAVDILQLQRILRYEPPAPLPDAPDFLDGIMHVEGRAVPVVDLRRRLGLPAGTTDDTRIMVLDLVDQRVGIVVDQAREVLRVDAATITAPPPMVAGLAAKYIGGLLERGGRTIMVLNVHRLLSSEERLALRDAEGGA